MTPSPTASIALAFRQGFGPRLTVEKAKQECRERAEHNRGPKVGYQSGKTSGNPDEAGANPVAAANSSHSVPQTYDILIRQP